MRKWNCGKLTPTATSRNYTSAAPAAGQNNYLPIVRTDGMYTPVSDKRERAKRLRKFENDLTGSYHFVAIGVCLSFWNEILSTLWNSNFSRGCAWQDVVSRKDYMWGAKSFPPLAAGIFLISYRPRRVVDNHGGELLPRGINQLVQIIRISPETTTHFVVRWRTLLPPFQLPRKPSLTSQVRALRNPVIFSALYDIDLAWKSRIKWKSFRFYELSEITKGHPMDR